MIRHPPRSTLFPSTPPFRSPQRATATVDTADGSSALVDEISTQVATVSADRFGQQVTTTYLATDRKSTRLNSSHANISYAVFCLKKKKVITRTPTHILFGFY